MHRHPGTMKSCLSGPVNQWLLDEPSALLFTAEASDHLPQEACSSLKLPKRGNGWPLAAAAIVALE